MGDRSYRSTAGEEMLFFLSTAVPSNSPGSGCPEFSVRTWFDFHSGPRGAGRQIARGSHMPTDCRPAFIVYDVNLSVACDCPAVAGILYPRDQSHLSILSGSTQGFSPSLQLTLLFHSANRVCRSDSQSQCCLVAEKQSTLFVTPTPAYPSFPWAIGVWAEPIRFG